MTNQTNNMTNWATGSIALLALLAALGAAFFLTTTGVSAQTVDGDTTTEEVAPRQRGQRTAPTDEQIAAHAELRELSQEVYDKDATSLAVAEALGVSVEEMQAAKEDGTLQDLMDAAGMTREDVKAIVEAEKAAQLAAAVANGTITQEQADELSEKSGRRGGGRGHGKSGNGRGNRAPAAADNA